MRAGGHQTLTRSPVRYRASAPAAIAAAFAASSTRPAESRIAGAIWTITWTIAPTPTPSRNADSSPLSIDAPISAPRIAGAPAIRPRLRQPRWRHALADQRRDDRDPLGGVVDREADDQEGAQGELADGVRGADREALAEVVEADSDRDHSAS